jgi:hypothetical protein
MYVCLFVFAAESQLALVPISPITCVGGGQRPELEAVIRLSNFVVNSWSWSLTPPYTIVT